MMNFLKKLLGLAGTKQAGPSTLPGSRNFQSSVQGGAEAESVIRSQLVQVMMRDVMRASGIPSGWIECQTQVVASRSRGPGIYVRLVVKHWDNRLMQHTFAFQKALLTAIVQFEPKAATWLHGIAWQFEVASTCPHTTLPNPDYWLEAPQTYTPANARVLPDIDEVPAPVALPVIAAALAPSAGFKPVAPAETPLPLFEIEKPTPEHEATADLERLFAIRDNELARQAAKNPLPVGYEKTEPAPL